MLDKIQGDRAELIGQSASLDRIKEIDLNSHYSSNDVNYIVDESDISSEAYEKYIREQDVKRFSKILMETDEKEANELVLRHAFNGTISIDDDDFLGELLGNSDFLDDII
ncbi:hypothetical protein IJ531_01745 [bacterium]|nr:hypothetical protein [bacterium]